MTALKFCRRPNIDDGPLLDSFFRSKIRKVDPFFFLDQQSGNLCLTSSDPATDPIETDAIKLPNGQIGILRLFEH